MLDPRQIENDLRDYLANHDNLKREDRLTCLMAIVNKHLEVSKLDHVVSEKDWFDIISMAKSVFVGMSLPIRIGDKTFVKENDAVQLSLIESFIGYLNNRKLLKRLVRMDYTGDRR